MAGDDDILDGTSDGLTDAERTQFNEMQSATSGDLPPLDPAAGADAGAGAGDGGQGDGADAAAAAAAGAADAGAGAGGDKAGVKDGAADAGAAADDDDDDADAPVVGADGKPAVGADGKPVRRKARVSANKYNAEKERADKLAADLGARDQMLARADERMRLISEALTTPKPKKEGEADQDQEPDPEADAFGWMKWSRNKTAQLEKSIKEIREGKQTEDGQRVVADAYMQDATALVQREPNFVPAYNHLMASRSQELAMYFYGVDLTDGRPEAPKLTPRQVQHIKTVAAEEERGIVENAIAQGRSPAAAVYQMAQYRGFRPQTKEQREAAAAAARGANGGANGAANGANGAHKTNGKANGAAENGGKGGSVSEEIARIKAGTEASLSLSDGGGSPANPMTPQKLAEMPQEQFDAIMERADPDEIRRLFEGQA